MSTVTNPYTFNIESNCEFSTDPLIIRIVLTMKCIKDENTKMLIYSLNNSQGSLVPNKFNDVTIKYIELLYNVYDSGQIDLTASLTTNNNKYSKIILNCALFPNFEFIYKNDISSSTSVYNAINSFSVLSENVNYWEFYDNYPMDLTIKFV